ncbi:hypothetical protein BDV23DRAFT_72822 [Aspergillus alliaceus]|uniref:Uncharacterized protein n=1 Tax=Petromyces alliaceus TaxID=209559 RepID=A0A5N7CAR0_PETAA|nr:hypothetical protein BDV23DRAFT_72822 [Aspergillus alliaceus]
MASLESANTIRISTLPDGGIHFTDRFNDMQNTYLLNMYSDYQQMDRDIQWYFPDLQNIWRAEIQIYDSEKRRLLAPGQLLLSGKVIMLVALV